MSVDGSLWNCDLIDLVILMKTKTFDTILWYWTKRFKFCKSGISSDLPYIPANGELYGIL